MIYAVGEVTLRLPPLRQRREDIPDLLQTGIASANRLYGKKIRDISKTALNFLSGYDFPDNIRELFDILKRAVRAAKRDVIFVEDLGIVLNSLDDDAHIYPDTSLLPLAEMEKRHIKMVLARNKWNTTATCRILHITPSLLRRKILLYGLTPD